MHVAPLQSQVPLDIIVAVTLFIFSLLSRPFYHVRSSEHSYE